MLLKILLDPDFDEKSYRNFKVGDRHEIYVEVTSVQVSEHSSEFYLKECPILTDAFEGLPEVSVLQIHPKSAVLYCEWNELDEDSEGGLNYIELTVEAQECDRFPTIRKGASL